MLLAVIFMVTSNPMQCTYACETNTITQIDNKSANVQRDEVIIIKYRWDNGVMQYRRWNETHSCWIDPNWIDVN